jgi:hypothetical protein
MMSVLRQEDLAHRVYFVSWAFGPVLFDIDGTLKRYVGGLV